MVLEDYGWGVDAENYYEINQEEMMSNQTFIFKNIDEPSYMQLTSKGTVNIESIGLIYTGDVGENRYQIDRENANDKGVIYAIDTTSNTAYVKGFEKGLENKIKVRSFYKGYPVTKIGDSAFFDCSSLTSVIIPNSVTVIETNAFGYCSSLTSIEISNSVTSIGSYAFEACSLLTSVDIPNSVTEIGNETFSGCSALISVIIPDSVSSIHNSAFEDCTSLSMVVLNRNIQSIGKGAFNTCPLLEQNGIYYEGSVDEWNSKNIKTLGGLTIHFFIETEPTSDDLAKLPTDSLYWHYVDGVPTLW